MGGQARQREGEDVARTGTAPQRRHTGDRIEQEDVGLCIVGIVQQHLLQNGRCLLRAAGTKRPTHSRGRGGRARGDGQSGAGVPVLAAVPPLGEVLRTMSDLSDPHPAGTAPACPHTCGCEPSGAGRFGPTHALILLIAGGVDGGVGGGVLDLGRDCLKTGVVTAVQQNGVASGGKVERDGAAQALGGAGDQGGSLVHALTLAARRRGRGG